MNRKEVITVAANDALEFRTEGRKGYTTMVIGTELEIDFKDYDLRDLLNTAEPLGLIDMVVKCPACNKPTDTLFEGYCPKCARKSDFDAAITLRNKAVAERAERSGV